VHPNGLSGKANRIVSFGRRAFFYLLLFCLFFSACATVKPAASPPNDFLPPGPKADAYYHFLLAQLYQQEGNIDEAIKEYSRAVEKDRTSAYLRNQLAVLYLKKGFPEKALQEPSVQIPRAFPPFCFWAVSIFL
jgi:tetratricopeptide (TPR) repeat protein